MSAPLRDPCAEPAASTSSSDLAASSSSSKPVASGGLTLGLPRSKGGGGAKASSSSSTPTALELRKRHEDDSIRSTDNDAIGSRLSAIQAGYLEKEPFSQLLYAGPPASSSSSSHSPTLNPPPTLHRPPIINIGTYLRCTAIDRIVASFLASSGGKAQIVSLGAGSDSRFWRIAADPNLSPRLAHYLELDFSSVTARKLASIQRQPALSQPLGEPTLERCGLLSPRYALRGCDLRRLADEGEILTSLDPSRPTLILAECVLSYMPPQESVDVLAAVARRMEETTPVAAVCYEMCVAGEGADEGATMMGKFGQTMLRNLETRGLSLSGARQYRTTSSHVERLQAGLSLPAITQTPRRASSLSLARIYSSSLSPTLRNRINRIEGLDEVEELQMLLGCYAVSWGVRGGDETLPASLERALRSIE
ncbi:S-adenosyl-L-methionine-dependent methyltransferase [Jaminaea rosea]|uniref:Leucine carboxyl methyltransferase 1 n=1 Tax=Jaminaea rosea TaxID=1569628 RepID=A0A316UMS8_9BASI|nr:S-adenosyl-L-methionine-dependent methyltransferase [Jaminaea rosea]PWN25671.1 S-adenosyl-L-methionine-dependent methyltransferase [Jaminaea rosea]